jgi:Arc/MetJ family transcription regulator
MQPAAGWFVLRIARLDSPWPDVYNFVKPYTYRDGTGEMRTNIDIDDTLLAEARKLSGEATKKGAVEQALRLLVRLRRQQEVDRAFGKYRWRGNLARSRKGRGAA